MAQIRPFAALRYDLKRRAINPSDVVAPPYDVLDEIGKAQLVARHPQNIVNVDLPHLPPKTVGPDEVYEKAHITFESWVRAGVVRRDGRAALYPYTQTFDHGGRTCHRKGFFCLVKLAPFGQGHVVPHEKTYAAPIEDRLKLMRATRVQLSPIFGLFNDPRNAVSGLLYQNLGRPEMSATMDGVKNDLWSVTDANVENQVIDKLGQSPVYIADGHHRYTTALAYLQELEKQNGGPLPPAHPANWCMFSLVSMEDDGLTILPTHRLIGGLSGFDIEAFKQAVSGVFDVTDTGLMGDHADEFVQAVLPRQPMHSFGLFDGRTRKLWQLSLRKPDVLAPLEPSHSDAWRRLDVAILHRYLLDEVIQPRFAGGKEPIRSYTADPHAIAALVDGDRHQIALLLRPTPLHALEELGKKGEVMPPKSTYFFPKVATGMVFHALE